MNKFSISKTTQLQLSSKSAETQRYCRTVSYQKLHIKQNTPTNNNCQQAKEYQNLPTTYILPCYRNDILKQLKEKKHTQPTTKHLYK